MTKAELEEAVAQQAGVTKAQAKASIDATFQTITKALKKDKKFSVPQFGTFKVTKRKARVGRNPKTGEPLKIKASKSVSFKQSTKLKESI